MQTIILEIQETEQQAMFHIKRKIESKQHIGMDHHQQKLIFLDFEHKATFLFHYG